MTPDFDLIFKYLPEEIKKDDYASRIEKIVRNTSNPSLLNGIGVPQSVYDNLDSDLQDYFRATLTEKNLLYFECFIKGGFITYRLRKDDDKYTLVYNTYQSIEKESINTQLEKYPNYSIVTTSKIKYDGDKIISYAYDIYFYDKNYELLPIDTEKFKDEEFADTFGVPLLAARFLRKNFSDYIDELNTCREIAEMEFLDKQHFENKDLYFRNPLRILELLDFMNKEARNDEVKEGLEDDGTNTFKASQKIEYLISTIGNLVGFDGEIIISNNLYEMFLGYLYNMHSFIHSRGFIIKKSGQNFTLYYIMFTKDNIVCMPYILNSIELKQIYDTTMENNASYELEDFFLINPEEHLKR